MAKKTVATLQTGEGRTYSKIIKAVKSPKTGAYVFKEEMVPNDAVKDALKQLLENTFFLSIDRGLTNDCVKPLLQNCHNDCLSVAVDLGCKTCNFAVNLLTLRKANWHNDNRRL